VDAIHIQTANNGWIVKSWTAGKRGQKARVDVFSEWGEVEKFLNEPGMLSASWLAPHEDDHE
jgi:hypothetical protein